MRPRSWDLALLVHVFGAMVLVGGLLTAAAAGIIGWVGGVGVRRMRSGGGNGLIKATSVIATVLVAAYVVTVWAMGGKPS